jgi:hypothetical protein
MFLLFLNRLNKTAGSSSLRANNVRQRMTVREESRLEVTRNGNVFLFKHYFMLWLLDTALVRRQNLLISRKSRPSASAR